MNAFTAPPMPQPRPGQQSAAAPLEPNAEEATQIGAAVVQDMEQTVPAEKKDAFNEWASNPLLLMGLGMLASERGSVGGAFGEGALTAVNMIQNQRAQKFDQEREMSAEERERERMRQEQERAAWDQQFRAGEARRDQQRFDQRFGFEQEQGRDRMALERDALAERARVNDARIDNYMRPSASAVRTQRDPYLDSLYTELAKVQADPYADPTVIDRLLEAIAMREAPMGGTPELPPDFEVAN
jgi:hypothetical protein